MRLLADLHIHSPFSMASSSKISPATLDAWARLKGIHILGSGDCVHPGWLARLEEELEPAEDGLFRLKSALASEIPGRREPLPGRCTRFLISGEICTISRTRGATRRIHHLLMAPDFSSVKRLQRRFTALGVKIQSNGRPIVKLDPRDLLELILETIPRAAVIPAHIWTPWYSILGSRSGFSSIEECYNDLTSHIRSLETGLSSDPAMNRLCSSLDRFTLVSNSDAHSPENIGREANILECGLSYPEIIQAMGRGGPGRLAGTVEFFPQQGKYHHDGHRSCGVRLSPEDSARNRNTCPVCRRPLTLGVLHRVKQLADRTHPRFCHPAPETHHLIPLKTILSAVLGVAAKSRRVEKAYLDLVPSTGTEMDILLNLPPEELSSSLSAPLLSAVSSIREGRLLIEPGFDGRFGRIDFTGKV